jgi:hypothetical protein
MEGEREDEKQGEEERVSGGEGRDGLRRVEAGDSG